MELLPAVEFDGDVSEPVYRYLSAGAKLVRAETCSISLSQSGAGQSRRPGRPHSATPTPGPAPRDLPSVPEEPRRLPGPSVPGDVLQVVPILSASSENTEHRKNADLPRHRLGLYGHCSCAVPFRFPPVRCKYSLDIMDVTDAFWAQKNTQHANRSRRLPA